MTELINSLKIFASSGTDAAKTHLRSVPLMALGRTDSCSESGFNQWRDAMRMVARLPGGLPPEFRIRLWDNLADRYLYQRGLEWARVIAKARACENIRDEDIADQIDKDLHRTGCTGFSGAKQAVLKRVLVAYARWNPAVGYCQGFNMIGAMLLQMTSGDEQLTLKIFVFLIEGVLPQGYFSQGLRGLAVDMAVFREILKLRKPTLNSHLAVLQKGDDNPPLTDVFTMHWFLTLFIHCLPTPSVLRIWDLVLLEGSEVLLRTALVLWAAIETRVLCVTSADEFYSVMGVVTREMLEFGLMDPNSLVKCIVSVGPFPFPGLDELRQKHRAIISQDTPHKSFFLAKRELDNLKRHYCYAAVRHRQKATTIILRGLDSGCRTASGARAVQNRLNNLPKNNPNNQPNKKPTAVSPKPKPRRTNSGGKSVLLHNNKNSAGGNYGSFNRNNTAAIVVTNANHHNYLNSSATPNNMPPGTRTVKGQQVTVPWDRNTKKPKNFRKRSTTSSSHSSSSSSSTELCDSLSDMENDDDDDDSVWTDADGKTATTKTTTTTTNNIITPGNSPKLPTKSELIVNEKTEEPVKQEDTTILTHDNELGNGGKNPPRTLSVKSTSESFSLSPVPSPQPTIPFTKLQLPEIIQTEVKDDDDHGDVISSVVGVDSGGGGPVINIDKPSLQNVEQQEKQEEEPEKEDKEKVTVELHKSIDELEDSGVIMMSGILESMDVAKCIDTNDSQHFLEEMSRLGKSDSFYENLSQRICELQFQNLRILTTCNTIPEPVVYSPLPSPMSPLPPMNPPTPPPNNNNNNSSSKSMNLSVPFTPAKLILSPSLNHLSLSTSPRGSVCSSTPGSPMVSDFPGGGNMMIINNNNNNSSLSRNSSRRTSKSSISSIEQVDDKLVGVDVHSHSPIGFFPKSASSQSVISNSSRGSGGGGCDSNVTENPLLLPHSGENPLIPSRSSGSAAAGLCTDGSNSNSSNINFVPPSSTCDYDGGAVVGVPEESDKKLDEGRRHHLLQREGAVVGQEEEDDMVSGGGQGTEDINAVIRENIAILQRLKLNKPAYDDDDRSSSPSSVSEFSDSDCGGALDLDYSSSSTNIPSRASSITMTALTTTTTTTTSSSRRQSSLSRCGSSGSVSGNSGRLSSLSRTTSVCLNCSRSKKVNKAMLMTSQSLNQSSKPKKNFNPFPTARKARVRTTKFGLYT